MNDNEITNDNSADSANATVSVPSTPKPVLQNEDWWAVILGSVLLLISLAAIWTTLPADAGASGEAVKLTSPLKAWLGKPGSWKESPLESFLPEGKDSHLPGILGMFLVPWVVFGVASRFLTGKVTDFLVAFVPVFLLATLAYVLASQHMVKYYGLSYALWALCVGLVISNTVGTPAWIRPAVRTELYIKTGLVVFGAEVLVSKLLALGVPGIFVAWVVTPIVLVTTFWFGQKILKISSPTLNIVISADMSVCGVSAAIATAAACRAKKEELSAAIGLSLIFTVVMMVVMPVVIKALGLSDVLAGAWMGGTIDATGAVAAAGEMISLQAMEVAATVKMIQNILIGVTAFCVAVYWVNFQERSADGVKPQISEIWHRFPKFVIGFLGASLVFSLIYSIHPAGEELVKAMISGSTATFRGWFFCFAFVSIGLDTNFKELAKQFRGGKPLVLYVVGQSFNLLLTLFMAWLMFEKVFPGFVEQFTGK